MIWKDYSCVTFIHRELARDSKGNKFDKEFVEDCILGWMPFKVRKHMLH